MQIKMQIQMQIWMQIYNFYGILKKNVTKINEFQK